MRILAFLGVIFLGLSVLVTHLAVTFIIGVGPAFVVSTCGFLEEVEPIVQEEISLLAHLVIEAFKEDIKKPDPCDSSAIWDKFTSPDLYIELEPANLPKLCLEDANSNQVLRYPTKEKRIKLHDLLDDPNALIRYLNVGKKSEPTTVRVPLEPVKIPLETFEFSSVYHPTEFSILVMLYGVIGAILIITGTTFLAVTCLRWQKSKNNK